MPKTLSALLLALTLIMVTAPASDAADPDITVDGWWSAPGDLYAGAQWSYPSYKVNCNTNPERPGVQVIFVRPSGSADLLASRVGVMRELMRRVASMYSASRRTTIGPAAATLKYEDRSPRFVTWTAANGQCHPVFVSEVVPPSPYAQGVAGAEALWDYLAGIGYDNPRRKYVVIHQNADASPEGVEGMADPVVADTWSVSNPNNAGGAAPSGYMSVWTTASVLDDEIERVRTARAVAHELAHALGAVQPTSPMSTPDDTWHSRYYSDLLRTIPLGARTCPPGVNHYRFDWCGDVQGYFTQANENWGQSLNRLDVANSSFLWGGTLGAYPL